MSLFNRIRGKKAGSAQEAAENKVSAKEEKVEGKKTVATEKKADKKSTQKKSTSSTVSTAAAINDDRLYAVLVRPVITEKATMSGTYIFEVNPNANASEVSKAVERLYGVKPTAVRMMNVKGKKVRWNYREGQRKHWKKAIVTLPKGQTINVYQGT